MKGLLQVSLRQKALFVPAAARKVQAGSLTGTCAVLVANLAKLGYGVSPDLLYALGGATPAYHAQVLATMKEVMGVNKNWAPLVKDWGNATGENLLDHIITYFTNLFQGKGTRLECGHIIPANTFPLERYNGCPYCGMPFITEELKLTKNNGKLKVLELWTEKDAEAFLYDLLLSKTALDATQTESLNALLDVFPLPMVDIAMKETRMAVIDKLVALDKAQDAQALFSSPADIMRYLWFKHTGFLQIIEPAVMAKRYVRNRTVANKLQAKEKLKLKYTRKQSVVIAQWLNHLPMSDNAMCEVMHAKRAMWVRFIRALRLPEYSQRAGFEKLKSVLDKFYNEEYSVWQGQVNKGRNQYDADATFQLLKQRPGLFARSLFANMLWFGKEETAVAFADIIDKVPARLLITLDMYAEDYFTKNSTRVVKPLGGIQKVVPGNILLSIYEQDDLDAMRKEVRALCLLAVKKRFEKIPNSNKSMFIAPELFQIPLSIGDRSSSVQDMPAALMGTRFKLESNTVRLFMQWGTGLAAAHLDMDLSCLVTYASSVDRCSYSSLVITGCKHSGDIRSIPDKVGTAEYIEIDTAVLRKAGAGYVIFSCNAYTAGAITPNLVVGWMNSRHPMKISERTGVAYNPAHVQHQVRVVNKLDKGLVFGVLDVERNEVVWLEMPFDGPIVQCMDTNGVTLLLRKLAAKTTIGQLLTMKAAAQQLALANAAEEADEVYSKEWAFNTAAVTQLLID
ncbi:hypothetical protein SAMN05421788_1011454 [Filimonas lacunae]|uniref:Uncharacterized protein n=1 Tax=Filimonas lacunae TaxID=477680 RepID=A0A173MQS2_9BACT|nr:hypothetical protein [Filimonas lacunae]BAV10025.1 hypothetical protein FLA_6079 [Filimonas lacunae]SIS82747.1 hypothetical protein SAMN05421788_1011454 [Filimonas lacunae]